MYNSFYSFLNSNNTPRKHKAPFSENPTKCEKLNFFFTFVGNREKIVFVLDLNY